MRGVWRLAGLCAAGWLLCGNGCGPGLEPPGGASTSIPNMMPGRTMTPPLQPGGAGSGAPVINNNPPVVGMGAAGGGFVSTAGTSAVGTGGRGGSSAEVDAGVDDAGTP